MGRVLHGTQQKPRHAAMLGLARARPNLVLAYVLAAIASAIATVRRAISACRRSTMRPSIATTPLSLFSGRSNAAIIFVACVTSSALGENAALQGPIWFG